MMKGWVVRDTLRSVGPGERGRTCIVRRGRRLESGKDRRQGTSRGEVGVIAYTKDGGIVRHRVKIKKVP